MIALTASMRKIQNINSFCHQKQWFGRGRLACLNLGYRSGEIKQVS